MTQAPDDPYRLTAKLRGAVVCPKCGASYHEGRWSWAEPPADAERHMCPACRRIEDHLPAGYVTLGGPFFAEHREEILNLLRSREARESRDHPLQRIMAMEPVDSDLVVTTTDPHLARILAHALHDAFKGDVDVRYSEDKKLVRATWRR